jgi:hypothetical protein
MATFVFAMFVWTVWPTPGRASLLVQVQNSKATRTGSGYFDVMITNVGDSPSVGIAGFDFTLSIASGMQFTAATTTTGILGAPIYVFAGNSFADGDDSIPAPPGPIEVNVLPDTSLIGADAAVVGSTVIAPSITLGLGRIYFSVPSGLSEGTIVPVIFTGLNLSDEESNFITDVTTANGEISIAAGTAVVPEPGTIVLAGSGMIALVGWMSRWHRSRTRA